MNIFNFKIKYDSFASLQGNVLEEGDHIKLHNSDIFIVCYDCLVNRATDHDVYSADFDQDIFKYLGLDAYRFCENCYGYKPLNDPNDYDWPNCKIGDFAALTRVVLELYDIVEGLKLNELHETSTTLFVD